MASVTAAAPRDATSAVKTFGFQGVQIVPFAAPLQIPCCLISSCAGIRKRWWYPTSRGTLNRSAWAMPATTGSDHSYKATPSLGSLLHAQELPR
ncbi:hypothetical protein PD5205_00960 [Xanthomonas fragariae]|uniref:Uncharacterized protein n=1 Tax=Xanthomonas fragariae TaxID=48664 RepID=A0A1Y6GYK1_9XANT|nr:hypothetical protein NBC2815_03048 [Xanthomonas fragariae]SMR00275.1 hypothetical protein PD885_03053 [Xanthomonas fragariae]SMR02279.1 hypothetical protein PD5205_00960 [Xanthomonas fragariae]